MARITVEDCLRNVGNRFELVIVAAKRARQLAFGHSEPLVSSNNDKSTVLALREIASGKIGLNVLNEEEAIAPVVREQRIEVIEELVVDTHDTYHAHDVADTHE